MIAAAAKLAVAGLLLALGACTTLPPPAPADLAGRLAVRVDAHAGQPANSFTALFDLRGNAQAGSLHLTTPLGTTAAQARWQPGLVELSTSEGTRRFPDLDALGAEVLGQALPMAALMDWLRGRAWAGAPSAARDGGFEQLGWLVDLSRFAEGWVIAVRDAAPAVTVRARLERPQ